MNPIFPSQIAVKPADQFTASVVMPSPSGTEQSETTPPKRLAVKITRTDRKLFSSKLVTMTRCT